MSHHRFNRRGTPHPWAKVFLVPNKRQTAHLAVSARSFQLNVGLLLLGGGANVEAFAILTPHYNLQGSLKEDLESTGVTRRKSDQI